MNNNRVDVFFMPAYLKGMKAKVLNLRENTIVIEVKAGVIRKRQFFFADPVLKLFNPCYNQNPPV
jgi:hypothetical protein